MGPRSAHDLRSPSKDIDKPKTPRRESLLLSSRSALKAVEANRGRAIQAASGNAHTSANGAQGRATQQEQCLTTNATYAPSSPLALQGTIARSNEPPGGDSAMASFAGDVKRDLSHVEAKGSMEDRMRSVPHSLKDHDGTCPLLSAVLILLHPVGVQSCAYCIAVRSHCGQVKRALLK